MAHTSSAKKRIKINQRNRIQNSYLKSSMKTFIRKYFYSLKQYEQLGDLETSRSLLDLLAITYSKIDKAKKKNIIHKNKAARKKSQLMRRFKEIITNNKIIT